MTKTSLAVTILLALTMLGSIRRGRPLLSARLIFQRGPGGRFAFKG
jgi:hypothetical protein